MSAYNKLSVLATNNMLNTLAGMLSNGFLDIRSGTRPSAPEVAPTDGVRLVLLPMLSAAFIAASSSQIIANGFVDQYPSASGTASYCRITDSSGTPVLDGDVAATGTPFLLLSSTTLSTTVLVSITGLTITLPVM